MDYKGYKLVKLYHLLPRVTFCLIKHMLKFGHLLNLLQDILKPIQPFSFTNCKMVLSLSYLSYLIYGNKHQFLQRLASVTFFH